VRQRCLAFALATGQEFGIWGGYDEAELRALHREQHLAERADRADRTLPA
jgi:hypothetical protein